MIEKRKNKTAREDKTMKIVVLDGKIENPGDLCWDDLAALGPLTVYEAPADEEETIRRIGDAGIVVTNKTRLTARVLTACPSVRLIAVLATGYNVVDIGCARMQGIAVANVPAYGTAVVSQFSIALLLEICHHIGLHSDSVHAGDWACSADWCYWLTPQTELAGKTMGIIGFGRIGQAEGKIAAALGMRVVACSPHPSAEGRAIAEYLPLERLLAQADVISLHCNLTPENTGLICQKTIAQMKDGVILLNTARGPLVVEQDLAEALNSGKVAAAGLDVAAVEPIRPDNPLLTAKNCILTPHIAWAARESRQRILAVTVENVRAFLAGTPQNVVNGACGLPG